MKHRRRIILVPLAAAAVALAFASVAYACTTIVGSISPTPASGSTVAGGSTVSIAGNGLNVAVGGGTGSINPNQQWGLYFLQHKQYQDSMKTCMGQGVGPTQEEEFGTTHPTQGAGNSVTISGRIPNKKTADPAPIGPTLGPALVCLISENSTTGKPDYNYATQSAAYTVT